MKIKLLSLAIIAAVCVSCSSTKKVANTTTVATTKTPVENYGSSFEKAIIINETSERVGISSEYAWLKNKYPGYKTNSQSLSYSNKKPYDILHITTTDGKAVTIYFDISNFYGKF